mgnify:CR=1 FL=1
MSRAKQQVDELRAEIMAPLPLMQHPVVQARIKGEYSLDQIRAIEIQHYYEARFFSTFVLNTIKNCNDDLDARKRMAENWLSEATGEDHASLIVRLLEALDVPIGKALATDPTPGMAAWHHIEEQITNNSPFALGVASLWIGEPEYPPVAKALHRAYHEIYGLPLDAIVTYEVHADADVQHGDQEEGIVIAALEADPSLLPRMRRVCRDAWSGYIHSFDGYWQAATGQRVFWAGV